ncbi:unnamed protein product [Rotaria sp. Silwood2]|nr:unnamed protein product [Rotaria sp. Silwood2]CAF3268789.1 unnamed protein product [Rotaria sp. Silwood2]CAF4226300.1 unnamed protein product [Rotaria sp. Silwood2]CAF4358269.1 unnamed protein product [Rotaria sp. Silwood2]
MVNGYFLCLGSRQHLENLFVDDCTIKIRLNSLLDSTLDQTVLDYFSSNFILKERHINILRHEIAEKYVSLKDFFSKLENLLFNERITDYSISPNTLFTLFVNFVRDQFDASSQTNKKHPDEGKDILMIFVMIHLMMDCSLLEKSRRKKTHHVFRNQSFIIFYNKQT